MTKRLLFAFLILGITVSLSAQTNKSDKPTWWDKYQFLLKNGSDPRPGATASVARSGANVDVSNECGPQSETFITINPSNPRRSPPARTRSSATPMRGYFSSDGGATWGGVDLPLPPPIGTNGTDSAPTRPSRSTRAATSSTGTSSSSSATGAASTAPRSPSRGRPTAARPIPR